MIVVAVVIIEKGEIVEQEKGVEVRLEMLLPILLLLFLFLLLILLLTLLLNNECLFTTLSQCMTFINPHIKNKIRHRMNYFTITPNIRSFVNNTPHILLMSFYESFNEIINSINSLSLSNLYGVVKIIRQFNNITHNYIRLAS